MERKFWIKTTLLIALVALSLKGSACGGGWDYRGFTLFFNPFEKSQPKYNYLYNPFTYTYDLDYTYNPPTESEIIIKEWASFLNTRNKEDVENLIYKNHFEDINALLAAKNKNVSLGRVNLQAKNKLYKTLYNNVELLSYVQLLQDYSYRVNSFSNEWEYAYHAKKADPYKLANNQKRAEVLFARIQNSTSKTAKFIKPRLAYHLVRSAYFNRQFEKARVYLNTYAPNYSATESGIIISWLEGMRGGVALHSNKSNEAILHYARVFNNSKTAHYQAYIDLKWLSNDGDLLEALKVATNRNDSLSIYSAASATSSKLASGSFAKNIQYIKDEEIRFFMWYREMQKVEETYFHPKICNKTFERWDDYGEYLKENDNLILENYQDFKRLTNKLYATCTSAKYKSHYANGLAYIQLMDGNYEGELPQVEDATSNIAKHQRTVFSLYQQVRANQPIETKDVLELLSLWKSDIFKLNENRQTLNYLLRDFVAPHYLYHEKDTLNALFLWGVSDSYYYYWDENTTTNEVVFAKSDVADVLINYTLNTDQYYNLNERLKIRNSPLLEWARSNRIKVSIIDGKENDLLFYKLVRDENWTKAEKQLYSTNLSYKTRKYFDPFLIHYDGYLSPTSLDSSKPLMNAHEFLRLGNNLKLEVQKNPTAQNELKYGQYLLSTTFHGHNSMADDADLGYLPSTYYEFKPWFYDVKKFGTYVGYYYFYESFEFEPSNRELDYYHCYKAEKYFKRAYACLTDKEDKAKCCFLLAKCVQKRAPIPPMVMNEYDYLEPQEIEHKGEKYDSYIYHSFTNPYLLELDKLYADTKTYQEAKIGCSYLRYILK